MDEWVEYYNRERPHQGIGMVPPIRRFELAVLEPFKVVTGGDPLPASEPAELVVDEPRRVTRKVSRSGWISLATFRYHVRRWVAGETVDVAITPRRSRRDLASGSAGRHPHQTASPRSRTRSLETSATSLARSSSHGGASRDTQGRLVGEHQLRRHHLPGWQRPPPGTGRSKGGRVHHRDLTGRETAPSPPCETRPDQSPRSLRQSPRQTRPDQRRLLDLWRECRGGTGARLSCGYRDLTCSFFMVGHP